MSLNDVRLHLVERLDEGDRGDRGWFIITRIHPAIGWLKRIAEFLDDKGAARSSVILTQHDYTRLGDVIGSHSRDPGIELRRHHLLVMDKPLQLLFRVNRNQWIDGVQLTGLGRALAHSNDPSSVLEIALRRIHFAIEPWTPPDRVSQYREFNVPVYEVTHRVLEQCGGVIDRNEFDFFVSRIRSTNEVEWAIEGIQAYRTLTKPQQESLHKEVRNRIPGEKSYQNWRDVALHTFSLFGLGTCMIREEQRLMLTGAWADARIGAEGLEIAARPRGQIERELRIPEPPEDETLLTPPAEPAINVGSDGESFVAKILRDRGWRVVFYTQRRGYGFDLWARRENRVIIVEVKSSLGVIGTLTLTSLEYQAARKYGENYVLAIVEKLGSDQPHVRMIQNPIAKMDVQTRETTTYTIPRAIWISAANTGD